MKLTPKQEKFCQGIIKGLNQSDAYRQAYDCKKAMDKTINENASRLMADSNISARINALKSKIEEKLVYSAMESFKNLDYIQRMALNRKKVLSKDIRGEKKETLVEDPDLPSAIRSEELKGKLAGLYTEKVQQSGTINILPTVKISGKELEIEIGDDRD